MKTAVLLVGYVRTWDQCKDSFVNTFGYLNPDVFVSTYTLQYGHHPHIQGRIGDNTDIELTEEIIRDKFAEFDTCVDIRPPLNMEYFYNNVDPMFHSASASFGQQLNTHNALRAAINNERVNGRYDMIIKTRCDLLYEPGFEIKDLHDTVTLDSGNVFPNDCVIIANRDAMISINNFMMEEFFHPLMASSGDVIPHQMLHNAISHSKLKINTQKIMDGVIRKTGEVHYY